MEKGNRLPVSVSEELIKISGIIEVADKLLIEHKREELMQFCLVHSEFFMNIISRFYDFNFRKKRHIDLFKKYRDLFNWSCIDKNTSLKYSSSFILEFKESILWHTKSPFYFKQRFIWNENAIIGCSDKIDFHWILDFEYSKRIFNHLYEIKASSSISYVSSAPWSINFIEEHYEKWSWWTLSGNENIPWSRELIDKFKEKWNWTALSSNNSIPWTIELVKKFRKELNWKALIANNTVITFDEEFIKEFTLEIFIIDKKFEPNFIYKKGIADRKDINWTINLIAKYKSFWNWKDLSGSHELPWSIELIEEFKDDWVWWELSRNSNITWSDELLQKYEEYWDWEELSANDKIKLDIEFLSKYKEKLNWKRLSENSGLFATVEIIEKFKDDWILAYLVQNKSIQWNENLITHFKEEIDSYIWGYLARNFNLEWTNSLINIFLENVDDDYESTYYIPLTEEFFFDFSLYLDWTWEDFSRSSHIEWDMKKINRYADVLNWKVLSDNETLYKKVFYEIIDVDFIEDFLSKALFDKK